MRVEETLSLVGLDGLAERLPGQVSGGQAQRVAVARALVRRPKVLLLDEPLSALDRNVRHAVRDELLRIHNELGTTFVLVTHDQEEALSMSQQVALMNAGRVEQVAAPEVMYRNPATLFAARFVGAGTFVTGRVLERSAGRVHVVLDSGGPPVSAIDARTDGERVQLLLRPEDLELAAIDDAVGGLRGVVEACAFFGAHYTVAVRSGADVFHVRSATKVRHGLPVELRWPDMAGIAYPDELVATRE
jgi:ABC-type Fe3+/spermidine/putrescine transport system ATPase subunit